MTQPTQKLLFDEVPVADAPPPVTAHAVRHRYDPSDEALAAFERLEEWLLDANGKTVTKVAEDALYALARSLLEGKRAWHHRAEDLLETLKLRNGKEEGDDIPPGNAPASDSFPMDVDEALDCLHEIMLVERVR